MEATDSIVLLAENLFWVKAPRRGKYPYANSFLITGQNNILIDAGIGEAMIKAVDGKARIDILLISHSHPDHMLKWHLLKDRHIMMPKETPDSIVNLMQMGLRFTGNPQQAPLWKEKIGDKFGLQPLRMPDSRFGDGDLIDAGGMTIQAIHAPGHLDDHYCFFVQEAKALLTTDIDFDNFGPWYGNPESDIDSFKASIHKIRQFPSSIVCSSHKPPIAGAGIHQAFEDYLALFDRHKQQVLDFCAHGNTLAEMVLASPFYRNRMPDLRVQKVFEEKIIKKILDNLIRDGVVREENGVFRRVY